MGVCRFNGEELNCDCPLDNNMVTNPLMMGKIGLPIDFEQNTYWNLKSARNLQNMDNYSTHGLRRINGPLRINGDLLVEGDILGQMGTSIVTDNMGLSIEDLKRETDISIEDLKREKDVLETRLFTAEMIIEYFCKRFAVNVADINKETEELVERNHVDKRLDAIE